MITKKHIEIYRSFGGDMDGFLRPPQWRESEIINADWLLIASFVQDIHLIKKGLASPAFADKLDKRLKQNCDSEETVEEFKKFNEYIP